MSRVICELCNKHIIIDNLCYTIINCIFEGPTGLDLVFSNVKSKLVHQICYNKLNKISTDKSNTKPFVERSDPLSIFG